MDYDGVRAHGCRLLANFVTLSQSLRNATVTESVPAKDSIRSIQLPIKLHTFTLQFINFPGPKLSNFG